MLGSAKGRQQPSGQKASRCHCATQMAYLTLISCSQTLSSGMDDGHNVVRSLPATCTDVVAARQEASSRNTLFRPRRPAGAFWEPGSVSQVLNAWPGWNCKAAVQTDRGSAADMRLNRYQLVLKALLVISLHHQACCQPPTPTTGTSPPPAATPPPPKSLKTAPPPPPASTLGKYDPCTSLGSATRVRNMVCRHHFL